MVIRLVITLVVFAGLWLGIARFLNTVTFTPAMSDMLVDVSASLGIYGNEAIYDFYLIASVIVAAILSALTCLIGWRLTRRRSAGSD